MQVSQWMRKYFYYFLLLVTSTVGGRVLTLVWYFVLVSDVPTGVTNVTLHGTIDMIHIKCKCPATKQQNFECPATKNFKIQNIFFE